MQAATYFQEALVTGLALIIAMYGAIFDPPASRVMRFALGGFSVLSGTWLVMLLVSASWAAHHGL